MAYIEIRAGNDVKVVEADQFRIVDGVLYIEVIRSHTLTSSYLRVANYEIIMAVRNWDFVGYLNPDQISTTVGSGRKIASVEINGLWDNVLVYPNTYYVPITSIDDQSPSLALWKLWNEEQAKNWLAVQHNQLKEMTGDDRITASLKLHQLYSNMASHFGWDMEPENDKP